MMNKTRNEDSFIVIEGNNPVLLSAPHAYPHIRPNFENTPKKRELYTKEIVQLISEELNVNGIYTTSEQKLDPNWYVGVRYRQRILELITQKNIRLFLDIHGLSIERKEDVIFFINEKDLKGKKIAEQISKKFLLHFKEVSIVNFINNGQFTLAEHVFEEYAVSSFQLEINLLVRQNQYLQTKLISSLTDVLRRYY